MFPLFSQPPVQCFSLLFSLFSCVVYAAARVQACFYVHGAVRFGARVACCACVCWGLPRPARRPPPPVVSQSTSPARAFCPRYASPTHCWVDGGDLCRARCPALASPGMIFPLRRCGLRSTSPTTGRIGASARSSVIRPPLVCCPRVGSGMPASAATPTPMRLLGAGGVFVHGVAHCLTAGVWPGRGVRPWP